MHLTPILFLVSLSLLVPTVTHATTITLGKPTYGGSGCPAGSTFTTVSPDGTYFQLSMDTFVVEAGGTQPNSARKSCSLSLPIQVPTGYSVSLSELNYNGFVNAPKGSSVQLTTEHSFAGMAGIKFANTFTDTTNNTFTKTQNFKALNLWSACGQPVTLRLNTAITVRTKQGVVAMGALGSVDNFGLVYHLQYRPC